MKLQRIYVACLLIMTGLMFHPLRSFSQEAPVYLRDRGTGIPMSQFGTYVRKGELLIYPFYEYYRDNNLEYEPFEFGLGSTQEFRGRYRAHEGLIFLGYGISDKFAVEFEVAVIDARLEKAKNDFSALPAKIEDSGLGDVEGQIRWRWNRESATKPEYFTYFETVFPTGEKNSLIGTSDWEFKLGSGLVKGFRWGTMTLRFAIEYDAAEEAFGTGEYAIEYLRRLSNRFRFFAMLEGSDDEIEAIPEIQWHISDSVFLKANTGFGITSKATDFAPEVGIMFSIY
jgi:hypothetical protein